MMRLFLIGLFIMAFTSCQWDEHQKVVRFGREYTEAWNSQNPVKVADHYDNDALLIVNGDSIIGRGKVTNFAKSFMRNFPDMELIMDSLVLKGEMYQYHWTFRGTYGGPYGNGNYVQFSGFESWRFGSDGLIVNSIGTYDEGDFRKQLYQTDAKQVNLN